MRDRDCCRDKGEEIERSNGFQFRTTCNVPFLCEFSEVRVVRKVELKENGMRACKFPHCKCSDHIYFVLIDRILCFHVFLSEETESRRRGEEEKKRRGEEEKKRRREEEKKRRREEEKKNRKGCVMITEYEATKSMFHASTTQIVWIKTRSFDVDETSFEEGILKQRKNLWIGILWEE